MPPYLKKKSSFSLLLKNRGAGSECLFSFPIPTFTLPSPTPTRGKKHFFFIISPNKKLFWKLTHITDCSRVCSRMYPSFLGVPQPSHEHNPGPRLVSCPGQLEASEQKVKFLTAPWSLPPQRIGLSLASPLLCV